MSPGRILLVVPYKARDFDAASLVAWHLRRTYGHEAAMTNGYGVERKLLEGAPDLLVLDHLAWNFKLDEARRARSLGAKVAVLPTEGFFQKKEEAAEVAGALLGGTGLADEFLTWGDFQRDAIVERGLLPPDRVRAVGCPRFDFYREPWISLVEPKRPFLLRHGFRDPDAPLVVWATNTPYHGRSPKRIIDRYVRRARWDRERIANYLDDQTRQFELHSAAVRRMAERRPGWNFLVKVHPAEWINAYAPMAESLPNVRLGYNAPVRDYLVHADLLLERNCTTATEMWILGKPVIDLEIGRYHEGARPEYKEGNEVVTSAEEAEAAAERFLAGAPVPESQARAREAFLREFYGRLDGRAAERCAGRLHALVSTLSDAGSAAIRRAAEEARRALAARESRRLPNRVKDLLGIDRKVSLRFWKRLFRAEAANNLGRFQPEAEITGADAAERFRLYDRAASGAAEPVA